MAALNIDFPLINQYIGTLRSLINRPIGVWLKSRTYLYSNLVRNTGGLYGYDYDGWGTPIGSLADPYMNERVGRPTYLNDVDRDQFSNYAKYVEAMYQSHTLNVGSINGAETFQIGKGTASAATIELRDPKITNIIQYGGTVNGFFGVNPNADTDTLLGKRSAKHLYETITNALRYNTDNLGNTSISIAMKPNYGMNYAAFGNGEGPILGDFVGKSINKDSSLNGADFGPIYSRGNNNEYMTYYVGEESPYTSYIESLSYDQEEFYKKNTDKDEIKKVNPSLRHHYTSKKGETYIDAIYNNPNVNIKEFSSRFQFESSRYTTEINNGYNEHISYGESDGGKAAPTTPLHYSTGNSSKFGVYNWFGSGSTGPDDIVKYTNEKFRDGKYDTLIARFHTGILSENDPTQSAVSKEYGASHGRNLLKRDHKGKSTNSYSNPYCRVWTYHHQYHRLMDLIRPLSEQNDGGTNAKPISPYALDIERNFKVFRSPDTGMDGGTGGGRLTKYGVMNYNVNGLVNITPVASTEASHKVDVKKCMFSIENLAWKGAFSNTAGSDDTSQNLGLSSEQKGPFGGRIMWFPPYGITFNEQVSANWNPTDFIGRGESIYTYSNSRREGSLSFMMLIDHPSILNYWKKKKDNAKSNGDVNDVDSNEQQLLRFFAGCDNLRALDVPEPEPVVADPSTEVTAEPVPETKTMTFFVFFPNNYTGKDDGSTLAMRYLMNGVGAGVEKNMSTGARDNKYIKMDKFTAGGKTVGGYEVRQGTTVSIRTGALVESQGGFVASVKPNGGEAKYLYAQSGKTNNDWWVAKWAYRVDTDSNFPDKNGKIGVAVIDEKLSGAANYVDTVSSGLNSGSKADIIANTFNVDKNTLYAATDFFVALSNENGAASVLSGYYDPKKVQEIKDLFNEQNRILEITCNGWASSNGIIPKNKELAKRRAEMIQGWLKSVMKPNFSGEIHTGTKDVGSGPKISSVSIESQKLYRCAQVDIKYQVSKAETTQNTVKTDRDTSIHTEPNNSTITSPYMYGANTDVNHQATGNGVKADAIKKSNEARSVNDGINSDAKLGLNPDGVITSEGGVDTARDESIERYDNEGEFFELLEMKDPFMHHKITDKIKYFDPAFHSISPEGFNARLTFLQQCMRQGPTVGGSDVYTMANTANNLAFGRPPVCILRLGDFYYTKIIIHNINIEYDPLVWDLNTEGIGVMPMLANITLQFTFIGGSSMTGPIARLQNALSFNMYANTEVYDNRAEQVDFDSNGEIDKYKAFVPK